MFSFSGGRTEGTTAKRKQMPLGRSLGSRSLGLCILPLPARPRAPPLLQRFPHYLSLHKEAQGSWAKGRWALRVPRKLRTCWAKRASGVLLRGRAPGWLGDSGTGPRESGQGRSSNEGVGLPDGPRLLLALKFCFQASREGPTVPAAPPMWPRPARPPARPGPLLHKVLLLHPTHGDTSC